MDFSRIERVTKLAQILEGTSLEESFAADINAPWFEKIRGDRTVARRVFRSLDVPLVQRMLMGQGDFDSKLLTLYQRFLKQVESGEDLEDIVRKWFESSDEVTLKGELLLAQIGVEDSQFGRYLELVPKEQHPLLWQVINRESSLFPPPQTC